MSALLPVEQRDLSRVSTLALELDVQVGYLRWNMRDHDTGDRLRFGMMLRRAREIVAILERCERRKNRIEERAG